MTAIFYLEVFLIFRPSILRYPQAIVVQLSLVDVELGCISSRIMALAHRRLNRRLSGPAPLRGGRRTSSRVRGMGGWGGAYDIAPAHVLADISSIGRLYSTYLSRRLPFAIASPARRCLSVAPYSLAGPSESPSRWSYSKHVTFTLRNPSAMRHTALTTSRIDHRLVQFAVRAGRAEGGR